MPVEWLSRPFIVRYGERTAELHKQFVSRALIISTNASGRVGWSGVYGDIPVGVVDCADAIRSIVFRTGTLDSTIPLLQLWQRVRFECPSGSGAYASKLMLKTTPLFERQPLGETDRNSITIDFVQEAGNAIV